MASKLSQLRMGKPASKIIDIRGMRMAVVILPIDTMRDIEYKVEKYALDNDGAVSEIMKNQYFDTLLAFNCLRNPENLDEYMAETEIELGGILDSEDINKIATAYGEIMVTKAPKLELLSEDQFEDIKKFLEVTPLNDIGTVSLVHLTNFHQTIVS
jgi:hypothetical protein